VPLELLRSPLKPGALPRLVIAAMQASSSSPPRGSASLGSAPSVRSRVPASPAAPRACPQGRLRPRQGPHAAPEGAGPFHSPASEEGASPLSPGVAVRPGPRSCLRCRRCSGVTSRGSSGAQGPSPRLPLITDLCPEGRAAQRAAVTDNSGHQSTLTGGRGAPPP